MRSRRFAMALQFFLRGELGFQALDLLLLGIDLLLLILKFRFARDVARIIRIR